MKAVAILFLVILSLLPLGVSAQEDPVSVIISYQQCETIKVWNPCRPIRDAFVMLYEASGTQSGKTNANGLLTFQVQPESPLAKVSATVDGKTFRTITIVAPVTRYYIRFVRTPGIILLPEVPEPPANPDTIFPDVNLFLPILMGS